MVNRIYPPSKGPTGRLLFDLAQYLTDEGYEVTVLSADRERSQDRKSEDLTGVKIIRTRGSKKPRAFMPNMFICLSLFIQMVTLPKPQILVTLSDPPLFFILAALYAKIRGVKHIHWCHDLYPDILPGLGYEVPSFVQDCMRKAANKALRSCNYVVAISKCMYRRIRQKELEKHQLKVIENWFDASLFTHKKVEQLDLPEKFRVIFSGHLGRAHLVTTILSAAKILNENDKDIEFLFMGEGEGYERVARERARMGLDNVRLIPYQPHGRYRKIMESGDIHLISLRSGVVGCLFPSRLYDIFAIKRPCIYIGSKKCEIAPILEKYQAGLQIDQGKGDALAKAIRQLRDNGEEWHILQKGSVQAGQEYTPAASLEKWRKLISTLCE
jgi:colanic acid biosynthesis glycosyl transferase WcaI